MLFRSVLFVSCLGLLIGFAFGSALALADDQARKHTPLSPETTRLDEQKWAAAKEQFESLWSAEIADKERCYRAWDILWSWSKKGNLQARALLFMLVYPRWSELPQMFLPGRSGDEVSGRRDALILGIHSMGVQYQGNNEPAFSNEYSRENLLNTLLVGWPKGDSFLSCLKTEPTEFCVRYATSSGAVIEAPLVPTFDNYAREIEALVAQGSQPHCINFCKRKFWQQKCQNP